MDIAGLQKTTLLDYPEHIACTVFLSGCNLRCPFCHNALLVLPEQATEPLMDDGELLEFLRSRLGKLDGVCVTGGEPTLNPHLPDLLRKIRALGFLIKLDTNGTRPNVVRALLDEGLVDYVAMDIKNSPARYKETCGGADVLDAVKETAALLMEKAPDYEFRTTAVHPFHTPEDIAAIARWLQGARRYFLQQFRDSGQLIGTGMSPLNPEEMESLRQAALPYLPQTALRGL